MKFVKATYHPETKTVEYEAGDGTRLLKIAGTLSWRFNNPGNIIALPNASRQKGRIGAGTVYNPKKNTFAIISNIEVGEQEKCALLKRKYQDNTISEMMSQYAPESAGNDPVAYANFISSESGVSKDKKISHLNDNEFDKVVAAISKKEGGLKPGTEKWVYVTNVTVSDGSRPVADVPFKVTLGSTTYDWKTDAYGKLKTIIHTKKGMALILKYTNSAGKEDVVYSAIAGDETKNILLTRNFSQFSAKTLAENPKVPREKSTQKPIEYIVMSGDSLSKIAERYKTSTDEIAKNNNIKDVSKIFPGQHLTIYGINTNSLSLYIVSPGDTLAKIAGKYGVSLDQIARQNNISDPNKIYPGQSLSINTSGNNAAGKTEKSPVSSLESKSVNKKTQNREINTNKKTLKSIGGKNSGNPIALLPHDQREAPWMNIALSEAKKWHGTKEDSITSNYHALIGHKWIKNLVGTLNAWCSSFMNYCFQESGYHKTVPDPYRAVSFFKDSNNFFEIKKPIYGCAASSGKHATFVYGQSKSGELICLGGNQGDTIKFSPFNDLRFFLPAAYKGYYESNAQKELDIFDVNELNEMIGILSKTTGRESTR
ncbi:peptidoglycan-binding protein LysM [Enterobacter cancerogenus]|uniref:TIGR02594 family protein n=1 Tax=Enterobacter cancerogenus TaxID=69218 RepID=UPI000C75C410|nr:TIGR02594 family protein [Enterobacter cancerogenus]AUJ80826.1 peptidoglycan-binding protein LysM [Enterobacter cancerogenus]